LPHRAEWFSIFIMKYVIETHDLYREYITYQKPEGIINSIKGIWNRKYDSKMALNKTNLQIESGKIIGLVGANGAGKTTLLKILSGLVVPSGGDAKVLAFALGRETTNTCARLVFF